MSDLPTYTDLVAFERDCRASIAETFAIADQAVANGDAEDASFVAAQKEFSEARVQCAIACVRADNAGHPREAILAAAGVAIGQMLGSVMSSTNDDGRQLIVSWATAAMNATISGRTDLDATPVARVSSNPIVGGNA